MLCSRTHEIRKFRVAVVQRWRKSVQKRVMHVQSCCFININVLLFCRSRCLHCRCCLSTLLLWSKKFVTMVTWRHTFPLYSSIICKENKAIREITTLKEDGPASSSGASFFAWQRRARNEWLVMNRKGPWEGYRRQAKRHLARCLLPAFLCAHIFIKRETSGYEAGTSLRRRRRKG